MAEIQLPRLFQHGGDGHLGKWRRSFVFFGLSKCFYFYLLLRSTAENGKALSTKLL
jgi:hypothetical protein